MKEVFWMKELEIGTNAPDFHLSSTRKKKISLEDYKGKKNVLLAFFPLDFTPGWIKELTSWKEDYKRFEKLDTEVLAISVDHIYAHNVFDASLGMLPYPLLSDWHKETARKYGVLNEENLTAERSVFIINKQGDLIYKNTKFDAKAQGDYDECFQEIEQLI